MQVFEEVDFIENKKEVYLYEISFFLFGQSEMWIIKRVVFEVNFRSKKFYILELTSI